MSSLHKDAPKASLDEYLEDYEVLKEEIIDNVRVMVVMPLNKMKQIENIKKANRKYYENHKEEVNKQIADWRKEKYKNDEDFREKSKERMRKYREKKKKEKEDKIKDIE